MVCFVSDPFNLWKTFVLAPLCFWKMLTCQMSEMAVVSATYSLACFVYIIFVYFLIVDTGPFLSFSPKKGHIISIYRETLGIQWPCQMMSKGCIVTSSARPLPFSEGDWIPRERNSILTFPAVFFRVISGATPSAVVKRSKFSKQFAGQVKMGPAATPVGGFKKERLFFWMPKSPRRPVSFSIPWEPKTFIFRGYNPYIG